MRRSGVERSATKATEVAFPSDFRHLRSRRGPCCSEIEGNTAPRRVVLDAASRDALNRHARSATSPHRVVVRSRIVLYSAQLGSDRQVARHLRVTPRTVRRWRERFYVGGLDSLLCDSPCRGRKSQRRSELEFAAGEYLKASIGSQRPSLRALAHALDVPVVTLHRYVKAARLAGSVKSDDAGNCGTPDDTSAPSRGSRLATRLQTAPTKRKT